MLLPSTPRLETMFLTRLFENNEARSKTHEHHLGRFERGVPVPNRKE